MIIAAIRDTNPLQREPAVSDGKPKAKKRKKKPKAKAPSKSPEQARGPQDAATLSVGSVVPESAPAQLPSLKAMRSQLRGVEAYIEQLRAGIRERDSKIRELEMALAEQSGEGKSQLSVLFEFPDQDEVDEVEDTVQDMRVDTVGAPSLGGPVSEPALLPLAAGELEVALQEVARDADFKASLLQYLRYYATTPAISQLQALVDGQVDLAVDLEGAKPKVAIKGDRVQTNRAFKVLVMGSTRKYVETTLEQNIEELGLALTEALHAGLKVRLPLA